MRYDDGTEDNPGSGVLLGWFFETQQDLGVRFTPPAGQDYMVLSASWYSESWFVPGLVDVTVTQADDPANTTTAVVNVTAGGTWEVGFATPICIPAGHDYFAVVCPQVGVSGIMGDDHSAPDLRSYWSSDPCEVAHSLGPDDLMLWSCVLPCGPTPVENTGWGKIKSSYR